MRFAVASMFEVLGIAIVAVSLGTIALWLGGLVAGLGLLLVGLCIDPPRKNASEAEL